MRKIDEAKAYAKRHSTAIACGIGAIAGIAITIRNGSASDAAKVMRWRYKHGGVHGVLRNSARINAALRVTTRADVLAGR